VQTHIINYYISNDSHVSEYTVHIVVWLKVTVTLYENML